MKKILLIFMFLLIMAGLAIGAVFRLGEFGMTDSIIIGGQGVWQSGSTVVGTIDYDDTWAVYTDAWGTNYTATWL